MKKQDMIQLFLTPEQARVIEISFHNYWKSDRDGDDMRYISRRLGNIMLTNTRRAIECSLEELWQLRKIIDPQVKSGQTTGMDVLLVIYGAILELHPMATVGEFQFTQEENNAGNNYTHEDPDENRAGSRAGTETES